jgi:PPK2 family polyphosphate:nucleotide phosphotransferase
MTENREQSKESPLPLALQTRLCEELPCAACTPDRGNAVIDSAIVFGWSFEAGTVLMPPHVAKFLAHIGEVDFGVRRMNITKLIKRLRTDDPESFRLASVDPADTGGIDLDKDQSKALLAADIKRLAQLQKRLYADGHWAVLIVLQGMDAAGKDGIIAHVMSGLNPQGCEVRAFKAPSEEELAHDFLWRSALRLPERGRIGIFNRSHYEEVIVVRVHPEFLKRQKLPSKLLTRDIWIQRFKDIRAFERHLARNGVLVLKFFLHVSKEEQRQRLLARLEEPDKRWKFSMNDIAERTLWGKYMAAYEDMIQATSRPQAPWYVVPADNKPFARLVVAAALIEALEGLDLQYPKMESAALKEIEQVRSALKSEGRRAKVRKKPPKRS